MNILQISPQVPYPPIDGGKRGIFNITKPLAERGHNITLIALSRQGEGNYDELKKYCRLQVVPFNGQNSVAKIFANMFSPLPYTVSKYHVEQMEREICRSLDSGVFDIVHVDTIHCAYYGVTVKSRYNLPVILRVHDYLSVMMERFSRFERNPLLRMFGRIQMRKLASYEGPVCAEFDKCFMVSVNEAEKLKLAAPSVKTAIIPPTVDTKYFSPRVTLPQPYSILWFGALDWLPNADSLHWFVNQIFPKILAAYPQAKLSVVGSGRLHPKYHIHSQHVDFIGFVEDIREAISQCVVAVVPLRLGSGVRLKILELFSMGKAIVSTSLGAEGIGAVNGKQLLIADDADDFSNQVITLLGDAVLRQTLADGARAIATANYDCFEVAKLIEQEYTLILNSREKGDLQRSEINS